MNDAYLIPLFISGTILLMLFVFFIVAYLLVQKQKQNLYHTEKTRMIFDHQNKIVTARFEEQERAMSQMSREIHDNIGQLLRFAHMNVMVIGKYATDEQQTVLIDRTKTLLEQITSDVRNISHSLSNEFIKIQGLVVVLEKELEYINIMQQINCKIETTGKREVFDYGKELLIYRIAQEAIHNITKHAKASEILIRLNYTLAAFTMSITDNGTGFDKHKIYELNGIGFQNMLERAMLLNGSLDIESLPSHGCTITLRVDCSMLKIADDIEGQKAVIPDIS